LPCRLRLDRQYKRQNGTVEQVSIIDRQEPGIAQFLNLEWVAVALACFGREFPAFFI